MERCSGTKGSLRCLDPALKKGFSKSTVLESRRVTYCSPSFDLRGEIHSVIVAACSEQDEQRLEPWHGCSGQDNRNSRTSSSPRLRACRFVYFWQGGGEGTKYNPLGDTGH